MGPYSLNLFEGSSKIICNRQIPDVFNYSFSFFLILTEIQHRSIPLENRGHGDCFNPFVVVVVVDYVWHRIYMRSVKRIVNVYNTIK